ncbi:MAG TPA: hydrogenase iron-sulfur subunit [Deltaproteobacteria bacterium]|nr:hydrogenase iron-sulfur subunit [Deltaproteobacteria bacterium]HPQ43025.1 hydrogenase iron-sulfur subunit [Syntrophales bacterium]
MKDFTPKLICFSCKFGWGYLNGEGWNGTIHNLIPVTCSGQVDTTHVIDAFREGADGVLILGCSDKECHFQTGNYQARKRVFLLHKTLEKFGIEPGRLRIELGLDPDGSRIPVIMEEMKETIKDLGPLLPTV